VDKKKWRQLADWVFFSIPTSIFGTSLIDLDSGMDGEQIHAAQTPVAENEDGDWARKIYDEVAGPRLPRITPGTTNLFSWDSDVSLLLDSSSATAHQPTPPSSLQLKYTSAAAASAPVLQDAAYNPCATENRYAHGILNRNANSVDRYKPRHKSTTPIESKTNSQTGTSEDDLLATMAARLAQVERAQKQYKLQLVSAERELTQLRRFRDAHRITTESKVCV
jgi:hypothetical protein